MISSSGCLLPSVAYRGQDILVGRPWPRQEQCDQSAFSGNDRLAFDDDLELSDPSFFELDGKPETILDQSSETRRFRGSRTSGLAVDDSDVHRERV